MLTEFKLLLHWKITPRANSEEGQKFEIPDLTKTRECSIRSAETRALHKLTASLFYAHKCWLNDFADQI